MMNLADVQKLFWYECTNRIAVMKACNNKGRVYDDL
jgi:hypothetical protein